MLPPNAFRYFHFAHHGHTQDAHRDLELVTPKPRTRGEYLWLLTGWSYWTAQMRALIYAAAGAPLPAYVPQRDVARVRSEARLFLAINAGIAAASTLTGSMLSLILWVVPIMFGQPSLRAFLLAKHTACPMAPDMLANTRTTFTHRAVLWLSWEMPWHTAHHTVHTMPFHRLAKMSAEMWHAIKSTAQGYLDAQQQFLHAISERG